MTDDLVTVQLSKRHVEWWATGPAQAQYTEGFYAVVDACREATGKDPIGFTVEKGLKPCPYCGGAGKVEI